jgi:hypothetical protein
LEKENKLMSQYLSEAFKRLDALNEETFSITDNGLEDYVEFQDNDELDTTIDVIDMEAETEEDLEDSYVGKVILDCCVCHSKLYKDVEDVVIDGELANTNEECPFCYTTDGFKVIGQVATFGEESEEEDKEEPEEETENEDKVEETLKESKETAQKTVRRNPNKVANEGLFGIKTKKEKEKEARAKAEREAKKKADKENAERIERERQADVVRGWKEREARERQSTAEYNRSRYNSIKGDKSSNTGYRGVQYSGGDYYTESKSIKESIDEKFIIKLDNMNGSRDAFISKNAPTNPDDKLFNDVDSWFTYNKEDVMIFNSYSDAEHFWDEYVIGIPLLADSDDNYTWSMKDCIVKYNDKMESIKESVNNVNVETDDGIVNVSSDETGRVTVTTEPNTAPMGGEEVIAPVEPEVQSEISDNVGDGEEIEIDMDEFDEESFDELGEGYLKRVYENVNSFKTSNVSFIKDRLILEGVIKFNSGKAKKTNFIFGIREATKSGKVRFIGENKEIARGRKSFTVTGRVENKKFLSESLNYNYGVRTANGKAQRLYGTVKSNKRG